MAIYLFRFWSRGPHKPLITTLDTNSSRTITKFVLSVDVCHVIFIRIGLIAFDYVYQNQKRERVLISFARFTNL